MGGCKSLWGSVARSGTPKETGSSALAGAGGAARRACRSSSSALRMLASCAVTWSACLTPS
eukprot:9675649-Alexandrium_andersonii.AAC.1